MQLIRGDSANALKKLKTESIDATITSPPYDNLRDYKGYTFDFETIAAELYRVTKDGGCWYGSSQTRPSTGTKRGHRSDKRFISRRSVSDSTTR